jgi:N-acetylglucosamine-6-phosphate deacetylase
MATALINGRVLLHDGFAQGQTVLVDDGRISAVGTTDEIRARATSVVDLDGRMLLPGFIDTQVNGGGGVLFNDSPTVEGIRAIGAAHRRFGTTGFLPTLLSDDLTVLATAIHAVDAAIAARVPGVLGIHIEGPFLSEARKGVHDASHFLELDHDMVALLSSLKNGTTLMTLAPEVTSPGVIQRLAAAGVILAAGHTNATGSEIEAARRHGLRGFTHLFNAMSQMSAREPGTVGAALGDEDSYCGIIVDGKHVDPRVLKLAMRLKRPDRCMLVTDAMPCIGTEDKTFQLQGRTITVEDGVCVDDEGTLAGTALDMAHAVRNAVGLLGVPLNAAVRMASEFPADFLRLSSTHGRIAAGYRADFVVADEPLNVLETWIGGERIREA